MSLRIFHIIFVVVCIMLATFVGLWGFREWNATGSTSALGFAIVFLVSGVALVFYARRVVEKLRDLP